MPTKKRRANKMSGEEHKQIIEEFEHESELSKYYEEDETTKAKKIDLSKI